MYGFLKRNRRYRWCAEIILAYWILLAIIIYTPLFNFNILRDSTATIILLAFFVERFFLIFLLPLILFLIVWDKFLENKSNP